MLTQSGKDPTSSIVRPPVSLVTKHNAFNDLQKVSDIALNSQFPLDEKRGAEFKVNLDDGGVKLFEATLIVMHPRTGLALSQEERNEIAEFTNRVFQRELVEFRKKIKTDQSDGVSGEIWGAAVMAGDISKFMAGSISK